MSVNGRPTTPAGRTGAEAPVLPGDACYPRFQLRMRLATVFETPSIRGDDMRTLPKRSALAIAASLVARISVKKSR
jgi:hypothetical protein